MKHLGKTWLAGLIAAAIATPAAAATKQDIEEMVREWMRDPVFQISLEAQNRRHAPIDEETILELDKEWRAEHDSPDKPLMAQVMGAPISYTLLRYQARAEGLFHEIFVMDNKGLNVGLSSITTDYWQGDEAKFQRTFEVGPDAVFWDEPETADSGARRQQLSMTVTDDAGAPIGAITVEVNLDRLDSE